MRGHLERRQSPALTFFVVRAEPAELGHHVGEARRAAVDEGERPADLDRGDADARGEQAVDDAFAEPGGEPRREAVTEDLLDERIAGRHAAGDGEMGDRGARQAEEAERARPAAIERREPADEAQDLERRRRGRRPARAARSR